MKRKSDLGFLLPFLIVLLGVGCEGDSSSQAADLLPVLLIDFGTEYIKIGIENPKAKLSLDIATYEDKARKCGNTPFLSEYHFCFSHPIPIELLLSFMKAPLNHYKIFPPRTCAGRIPSLIGFPRQSEREYGLQAQELASSSPAKVFFALKRLLGVKKDSPEVKAFQRVRTLHPCSTSTSTSFSFACWI